MRHKTRLEQNIEVRNKLRLQSLNERNPDTKDDIEAEITKVEDKIAEEAANEYLEKILEHTDEMGAMDGTFGNNKMWKLK